MHTAGLSFYPLNTPDILQTSGMTSHVRSWSTTSRLYRHAILKQMQQAVQSYGALVCSALTVQLVLGARCQKREAKAQASQ